MKSSAVPKKTRGRLRQLSQKLVFTIELFSRNELMNHAAAGAYGFLLSAAPAFLLAAVLVSNFSQLSAEESLRFIATFGGLGEALDAESLARAYSATPLTGFSGLFAIANLIWTARVFALSLQRGIRVVFSGHKASPLRDNILPFMIELSALLYIFIYILAANTADSIATATSLSSPLRSGLSFVINILPFIGLGVLAYNAYRFLPTNRPKPLAALQGAIFCVLTFAVVAIAFRYLVSGARYALLYGSLGNMVVALVNVYFFFVLFFCGAQLAFVSDSFDALIFSRFRRLGSADSKTGSALERKLFSAPERLLGKFARSYSEGSYLFTGSETGREVYYILSGRVGIYLGASPGEGGNTVLPGHRVAELGAGNFVGEMAYLLSEERTASAYADSDVVALRLPPELFDEILKTDPETARHIISSLSDRLRKTNDSVRKKSATKSQKRDKPSQAGKVLPKDEP